MALQHLKSLVAPDPNYKHRPWGLYWRSHKLFITGTVAIGLFTDLFLYGLVVPVLPYLLQGRLGIPRDEVQPHVSGLLAAYAWSSVIFSPLAGYVADKSKSRQQPYLWGLTALFFATVLLYVAETEFLLALARILQGLSADIVWTIGLALCLETVGPKKLGITIGTIFSLMGFATLLAPIVGGVLYAKVGYVGVFGVSVGILGLDFLMRVLVIERKIAHRYDPEITDPLLDPDSSLPDEDDNESQPLLGDSGPDKWHIPSDQPSIVKTIPLLYCMKHPRLISALIVVFVQGTLLSAFDATVPTEAQALFNFTSLEAGLLFIPLGVCDLVLGPIAGWLVDKRGVKAVATLGFSGLAPVLIALRVIHAGGQDQVIIYSVLLSLCGIGLAAINAPAVVEQGDVVNKYHNANPQFFGETGPYAQLYSLNSMIFSLGLAVGPFLAGGLRDAIGYGNMNAVLGVICAFTALQSYLFIGDRPVFARKSKKEEETSSDT